jgi:hypothetical protein
MKKILFLFILVETIYPVKLTMANPIVYRSPQAYISELTFDSGNYWTIEAEMFISDPMFLVNGIIDSIVITSNEGRARVLSFPIALHQLFLINTTGLNHNLQINPVNDRITIFTYANPDIFGLYGNTLSTHTLTYGNPENEIPHLNQGQSICTREHEWANPLYYYLDNSPTLGVSNDTIGATVNVIGKFYDCTGTLITQPPTNVEFVLPVNLESVWRYGEKYYFPLFLFAFDAQGNYCTKILSRYVGVTKINYWTPSVYAGLGNCEDLACETFSFFMNPGIVYFTDIHLTDSTFLVGTSHKKKNKETLEIICAPNPVVTDGSFYFTANIPADNTEIIIFSLTGQQCMKVKIPPEKQGTIGFRKEQLGSDGLYIYSVIRNGKKIHSGYIICQ